MGTSNPSHSMIILCSFSTSKFFNGFYTWIIYMYTLSMDYIHFIQLNIWVHQLVKSSNWTFEYFNLILLNQNKMYLKHHWTFWSLLTQWCQWKECISRCFSRNQFILYMPSTGYSIIFNLSFWIQRQSFRNSKGLFSNWIKWIVQWLYIIKHSYKPL